MFKALAVIVRITKTEQEMKRLLLPLLAALALPTSVEASTYNLICTTERSYQISYIDKVNEDDLLTQNKSKYKEDMKSREKFKVFYNLKNNNGFIENNSAKAVRILDPGPYEYAPLFLYSHLGEVDTTEKENEYYEILSVESLKVNTWNIRIDRPTDSSTSFFSIKSLEDSEARYVINNSDELTNDTLTEKLIHEISTGSCNPNK